MSATVIRKLSNKVPSRVVRWLGNIWLPFLGAGIKVVSNSKDYRYIKVCLLRRWYNSNYVGTQFGGSIYAMTDPFYMLMLINNLGSDYIVWDKGAKIEFIKPGRSSLFAEFKIDQSLVEEIKLKVKESEKYIFDLPVEIYDDNKVLVAKVDKTLYVRRKARS